MSESAAAPRPQPTPGPAGRISILFDVIDAPSISYADAVDAVMHDSGSIPPSPPQWGHSTKGVAGARPLCHSDQRITGIHSFSVSGFFGSMFRPSAKNSAQARAALDSQATPPPPSPIPPVFRRACLNGSSRLSLVVTAIFRPACRSPFLK
jgi:hypothetical protein